MILKGAGDKAFCSGGDIRIILNIEKYGSSPYDLFRDIFETFAKINVYKIPIISLWNGIVMGGGIGFSVYGSHRIATERTLFAMPEVEIGLFPDAGASHFFNRLPGKLGLYMALTGTRLMGKDVFASGFATHYTESKNLQDIERDLLALKNPKDINVVLDKYCSQEDKPVFSLNQNFDKINAHFTAKTMEEIFKNLENDSSKFAQDTLKVII